MLETAVRRAEIEKLRNELHVNVVLFVLVFILVLWVMLASSWYCFALVSVQVNYFEGGCYCILGLVLI